MPRLDADPIRVPLPGGPLTDPPTALVLLAAHIRHELRRLVQPGAPPAAYQIRLPGGRTLAGTPVVLLRLAERIEQAALSTAGPAGDRARVRPLKSAQPYTPPPTGGTQRLPDLSTNLDPAYDPTDPAAAPGPHLYQYFGCIWSPAATAPDGWQATTAEVEIAAHGLSFAAVGLAVTEAVELADDEILAVRWAGAAQPTCFLTAAQVRLAQWLAAHPGEALPPVPRHGSVFRLQRP